MARTNTFQPNPKLGQFIEGLVDSGDYNNQSQFIRAAVSPVTLSHRINKPPASPEVLD